MKNLNFSAGLLRLVLVTALFAYGKLFAQPYNESVVKIAHKTYWSKLLHYKDGKSTIDTKEFFLSKSGDVSLVSELESTLSSFKNNPSSICRFPARYKWLHSLKVIEKIDVQCKDLDQFLAPDFSKVNIVYSTERYNSSASLFGHVLLKVDGRDKSNVIEYTAKVPKDTSAFSYAYNGILGGFVGKYDFFSFYSKDYEARDQEFRDLIVYELALSQDEIDNILLHLYEVKNTTQRYYFLSRNCSSELIKLLEVANYDTKETKDSQLFVLPVEVMSFAQKNNKIKSIKLMRSKLKEFNLLYETLSDDQKKVFKDVVNENRSVYSLINDKLLTQKTKNKVVLTALLYYEIYSQTKSISQKVLSKILTLSKYKINNSLSDIDNYEYIKKNPVSPYMYKGAIGYLKKQDLYATIGFRSLYKGRFDLLDGLVKNGSIELLDFKIRINEKLSLEYLTILNLSSMPISNQFFSEPTKELKIGLKRIFYDDKLYRYGEYGMGKRMKINDTMSYGFSIYTGIYDHSKSLFGLGLKTELEHKVLSKYFVRFGASITRYDDFESHIKSTNIFTNIGFKTSKNSLTGVRFDLSNDEKEYYLSSFYYNYSF